MMTKLLVASLTIALSLPILRYIFRQQKMKRAVNRWMAQFNLNQHAPNFAQIYQQVNGFAISQLARKRYDTLDYIYGEIDLYSFIAVLSLANPDKETIFYDLGCGVGKAVLASAMIFPVAKSIGIEILPELYEAANQCKELLCSMDEYANLDHKIHFILGDFLTINLADASIIFINSSTIFNPTWGHLCTTLNGLSKVHTIITTSKPLTSSQFTAYREAKMQMSWGIVTVYLHRRKTNNHNALENIE